MMSLSRLLALAALGGVVIAAMVAALAARQPAPQDIDAITLPGVGQSTLATQDTEDGKPAGTQRPRLKDRTAPQPADLPDPQPARPPAKRSDPAGEQAPAPAPVQEPDVAPPPARDDEDDDDAEADGDGEADDDSDDGGDSDDEGSDD